MARPVPLHVTIGSPDGSTLTLPGALFVSSHQRTEDDGGHGEMRTYLEVVDEDSSQAWCLVCVAQQMHDGSLLKIEVAR